MDRNQAIGLVLIAAILIVYSFVFTPPEVEPVTDEPVNTSTPTKTDSGDAKNSAPNEVMVPETQTNQATSEEEIDLIETYGVFGSAMQGESKPFVVASDLAEYTFDNKGGQIKSVRLKEFQTYDDQPLYLFTEQSADLNLYLTTARGRVNLSDLYFEGNTSAQTISDEDSTQISLTARLADGGTITQVYTIFANRYDIKYQLQFNGLQNQVVGDEMTLVWSDEMKRFESNLEDARNKTTVRYYTLSGDSDELKEISSEPQQETISESLHWVSFSQKFFNAGIIAEKGFKSAVVGNSPSSDPSIVEYGRMELKIPLQDIYDGANMKFYYGPNSFKILKKVTDGYEDNVYMGYKLVSWVNKYIIVELFSFLEGHFANYGIIIILIVLIVKMVLFPLTRKSYLSMAKMKALKPELDTLKEKHGDDMQAMQKEQMSLYREVGVNPISGCIPMLLQMPILFAMFFFFPNSIELRQQSFLWAHDLSTYDVLFNLGFTIPFYGSHVSGFTLLMTVSTILYTWSNNQVSTVQGPMKNIGYFMPIIFMFVLNSYSSGLSFYYFISNIITFGQQAVIRKFVDEDKIREKLEENKKKNANKGKSKFQQRLENAMKASQEMQKQKAQRKKKK